MMDRVFKDVLALKPQNWEELANAAKFLKGQYASFVDAAIAVIFKETEATQEEILTAPQYLLNYRKLVSNANSVYLAAKSASMEKKDGDFSAQKQIICRVTETLAVGKLIENFIQAAQTIGTSQSLFQEQGSHPNVQNAQDVASTQIFDHSLEIIEIIDERKEPLRPLPSTIIAIVKEELGILPEKTQKLIADVLKFRPS